MSLCPHPVQGILPHQGGGPQVVKAMQRRSKGKCVPQEPYKCRCGAVHLAPPGSSEELRKMAIRTRITYEILDLVRERAMEQDWELIFDSGPADGRTIIWEKEAGLGRHYELEIRFSPDGRIAHAEKRRDGKWIHRKYEMNDFSSTDVQIETLRMI